MVGKQKSFCCHHVMKFMRRRVLQVFRRKAFPLLLFLISILAVWSWYKLSSLWRTSIGTYMSSLSSSRSTWKGPDSSSNISCADLNDPEIRRHYLQFEDYQTKIQSLWYENDHSTGPLVIVFWHIAKTGGTTIRSFFGRLQHNNTQNLRVRLALKPKDFAKAASAIEHHLTNINKNDVLFVEFHGKGWNVNRWIEESRRWRAIVNDKSNRNQKDGHHRQPRLFLFTIWRHPVDHAMSYYHFFKNHSDPTGESFAASTILSRQCGSLVPPVPQPSSVIAKGASGAITTGINRRQSISTSYEAVNTERRRRQPTLASTVNPSTCLDVFQQLLLHMDWIGTTETLDQVTIPLLVRLLVAHGGDKQQVSALGLSTSKNQTISRVQHANVGTYYRPQEEKKSQTSSANFSRFGGDVRATSRAITAATLNDFIQDWIENEASCEDFSFWKQIAASMENLSSNANRGWW